MKYNRVVAYGNEPNEIGTIVARRQSGDTYEYFVETGGSSFGAIGAWATRVDDYHVKPIDDEPAVIPWNSIVPW